MSPTSAGDYYNDNLQMGVSVAGLCGHWKDELARLDTGLIRLEQERLHADPKALTAKAPVYAISAAPSFETLFTVQVQSATGIIAHSPDNKIVPGQPVSISVKATAPAGIKWVRLYYRAVNQQLEYKNMPMKPTGKPDEFATTIPAEEIDPTYDLMYYVALMDNKGNGRIWPDVERETPYRIIKFARVVESVRLKNKGIENAGR